MGRQQRTRLIATWLAAVAGAFLLGVVPGGEGGSAGSGVAAGSRSDGPVSTELAPEPRGRRWA